MDRPLYLDHLATTPVDPRVLEAMLPCFGQRFGNPASRTHAYGWEAERALERARRQVADLIGARPAEIVFTSGATEAIDLALWGAALGHPARGRHVVTTKVEHEAVLATCRDLEEEGFEVTYLDPEPSGRVDPAAVRAALREDTLLVAVIWANNELGTLAPVREIAAACRERGALFFSDATQAVGKVPVDVEADGIDLLCLSGHKLYGPKGIGALYVRSRQPRVRLIPRRHGGGQERGLRPGTPNVPGAVGLGEACVLAGERLSGDALRLATLRDRFEARVGAALDGVVVHAARVERLPHASNLSFRGIDAEALIQALDGLAVSSGAACASARHEPSHVLLACGVGDELARSSLRLGLGRSTEVAHVDLAAERVIAAVRRLRAESGATPTVQPRARRPEPPTAQGLPSIHSNPTSAISTRSLP